MRHPPVLSFFFFNDTATTEIYTLSLHDALPICNCSPCRGPSRKPSALSPASRGSDPAPSAAAPRSDRKSTRLNSSHSQISYAVFCLKKKKKNKSTRSPIEVRGNLGRSTYEHSPV